MIPDDIQRVREELDERTAHLLDEAIKMDPTYSTAYTFLAKHYWDKGEYRKYGETWNRIGECEICPFIHNSKNYIEILQERGFEMNDIIYIIYACAGNQLIRSDRKKAMEILEQVYDLALQNRLTERASKIVLTIAGELADQGDRRGAIEKYQIVINLSKDPKRRHVARLLLAKDYGFLGRFDEAEQVLDSCEIPSAEPNDRYMYESTRDWIRGQIKIARNSVLRAGESTSETY